MHNVDVNKNDRYKYTKQLKSAEEQLKLLNEKIKMDSDDIYIAVPILASVPLLNIQDQYNRVMGEDKVFTPENVKANKENLVSFLKRIYDNPERFSKFISYMDPIAQGIQYTYGIIREINELVEKRANVYVPSGHPNDMTIKWMADKRGIKPELYHYIATGEDTNDVVSSMKQELKDNNWYNFNLLSLSNARVVGIKSTDWITDYIYSAYDTCVNDSARGVYNLSPVRDGDKLIGYSYTEDNVNDYPYEEFPMNKEVANLVKYVGKDSSDVVASKEETLMFFKSLRGEVSSDKVPDKLYRVQDIYYSWDLEKNKIELQGSLVNKDLNLFFDKNKDGKIIFKKCDCEGSGRPGGMPIWGSCYSMLNAIARDIGWQETNVGSIRDYETLLHVAKLSLPKAPPKSLNMYYTKLTFLRANYSLRNLTSLRKVLSKSAEASELLSAIYREESDWERSANSLNTGIDVLSKSLITRYGVEKLGLIKYKFSECFNCEYNSESYKKYLALYDDARALSKWLDMWSSRQKSSGEDVSLIMLKVSLMYKQLAEICAKKGELYPSKVCEAAAKDLAECNTRALAIIKRRADGVQYIGDLYNEIKPD